MAFYATGARIHQKQFSVNYCIGGLATPFLIEMLLSISQSNHKNIFISARGPTKVENFPIATAEVLDFKNEKRDKTSILLHMRLGVYFARSLIH